MKNSFLVASCLGFGVVQVWAGGLPKQTIQSLAKALQDSNLEVRTAAAQAFAEVPDAAGDVVKVLETALIASADAAEQEALSHALLRADDKGTPKRLSDALMNPQFTWGAGAKPKAVLVVARIGGGDRKTVKWLTDLVSGEQEPAVRAAAARALGEIGAPPKK